MAHAAVNPHGPAGHDPEDPFLYGVMAEFDDAHQVVVAARQAREAGYRKLDAFSPFPVEGLPEALGHRDYFIIWMMFFGGIIGAITGFGFLWWSTVIDYPLNIGGRPLFSWPSFIPITFEMTVLFAALTGVFGMFVINGLPSPYHPVFDAPNFDRASSDRFFLCIEAKDGKFQEVGHAEVARFLQGLGPVNVSEVELRK